MSRKNAFFMALTITLAVVLCAGGALLLHGNRNTKAPEEYAGGTAGINFAEGKTHTAGEAAFVPAFETAMTEIESEAGSDTDSKKSEAADKNAGGGSIAVLNERPENVWTEKDDTSTNNYTVRAQLPPADSIGTLKIPSIGLTVNAYDSANTMEDMDKGVSHFQSTSYWDGNVGFSGHNGNRAYSFFGKLHNVKTGDTITYETQLGTRTYTVTDIWTIADDDWSHLERTEDNRLTLITCVSDPAKRLCVQAVEQ